MVECLATNPGRKPVPVPRRNDDLLSKFANGTNGGCVVAITRDEYRYVVAVDSCELEHVGDDAGSKSKPLADQISNANLLVAFAWFAAAAALVLWLTEGVAWWAPVLASLLALLWMGRLLWRRLQGFTGDGLGATQQICELAFYLGLAVTV